MIDAQAEQLRQALAASSGALDRLIADVRDQLDGQLSLARLHDTLAAAERIVRVASPLSAREYDTGFSSRVGIRVGAAAEMRQKQ